MKRILFFFLMLATFASAQTDSTDILITVREDGDTTTVGRWRSGMPVVIRDSWNGWGEREKQGNKFVIIRVGIAKSRIDSFLVNHSDSTTGLRRKYQLSRAAIQFVKNNRDANNIVRVTPAQLRNAFKRANRLRRFGEPQRMGMISDRLYIRWRNMLIGATPTTATVNTDGGGDYTSLAAAEAGEQKDLETANEQLTISCSGTTADVTAVVFDGWTTDATRYIAIEGDNNTGIWDNNKYTLNTNVVSAAAGLHLKLKYAMLKNIQIILSGSTNDRIGVLYDPRNYAIGQECLIKNVLVKSNSTGTGIRAFFSHNTASITNIINCVAYNFQTTNAVAFTVFTGAHQNIYNSIAYNCFKGFEINFGSITAKNCIYQSNFIASADGYLAGISGDYNISDLAGDAPGANSLNNTTVNFADASAGDFRLLAGSPGIDQGVDLSADPNYPFNTAIDGTIRPQVSGWDIGAFEYVQPATGTDKKSRFNGFGTGFKGGWKK